MNGRPLAYRLLRSAARTPPGAEWVIDDPEDLDAIPSGSARLVALQATAIAAVAVQSLAEVTGRPVAEVLDDLWPTSKRTTAAQRELPARIIWGDVIDTSITPETNP